MMSHYDSHGFPMVPWISPWFSHDGSMMFPWFSMMVPCFSDDFSHDFRMFFTMISPFPWFSHDFRMFFTMIFPFPAPTFRSPGHPHGRGASCGTDPRAPATSFSRGTRIRGYQGGATFTKLYTGWWFGTFFIFPHSWDDDPIWLIFFEGGWDITLWLWLT